MLPSLVVSEEDAVDGVSLCSSRIRTPSHSPALLADIRSLTNGLIQCAALAWLSSFLSRVQTMECREGSLLVLGSTESLEFHLLDSVWYGNWC